jgi:uncharacterized protein (DUF1330 family)
VAPGSKNKEIDMSGVLIGQVRVTDAEKYKEYAARVPAVVAQYDGTYVVRGGSMEVVEGHWEDLRMVVITFPSLERAKQWYNSPEYAPLIAIRQSASEGNLMLVEGV